MSADWRGLGGGDAGGLGCVELCEKFKSRSKFLIPPRLYTPPSKENFCWAEERKKKAGIRLLRCGRLSRRARHSLVGRTLSGTGLRLSVGVCGRLGRCRDIRLWVEPFRT
jgi:hypothetical protein